MPKFDSKLERTFDLRLNALKKARVIKDYRRAVKMSRKAVNDTIIMRKDPKCSYTPDFIITTNAGDTIIVETKGGNPRYWDYAKYRFVWASQTQPDKRFVLYKQVKGGLNRYYDLNTDVAILPKEMI